LTEIDRVRTRGLSYDITETKIKGAIADGITMSPNRNSQKAEEIRRAAAPRPRLRLASSWTVLGERPRPGPGLRPVSSRSVDFAIVFGGCCFCPLKMRLSRDESQDVPIFTVFAGSGRALVPASMANPAKPEFSSLRHILRATPLDDKRR
jgi:hypothetical protein